MIVYYVFCTTARSHTPCGPSVPVCRVGFRTEDTKSWTVTDPDGPGQNLEQ